jgi:7-keto-8-aminopelargonate synthetase-like enzyme
MLVQRACPFLFSTRPRPPSPPPVARIRLEDEPELIERLWANTRRFKAELV